MSTPLRCVLLLVPAPTPRSIISMSSGTQIANPCFVARLTVAGSIRTPYLPGKGGSNHGDLPLVSSANRRQVQETEELTPKFLRSDYCSERDMQTAGSSRKIPCHVSGRRVCGGLADHYDFNSPGRKIFLASHTPICSRVP
jgi:hypothetical protein